MSNKPLLTLETLHAAIGKVFVRTYVERIPNPDFPNNHEEDEQRTHKDQVCIENVDDKGVHLIVENHIYQSRDPHIIISKEQALIELAPQDRDEQIEYYQKKYKTYQEAVDLATNAKNYLVKYFKIK